MPWRMNPDRTKITFMTFVQMPALIYRARQSGGQCSNTRYIQEAVCEKLARDGIEPLPSLLAKLPRDAAQYHDTLRETGVA
jgi:hypothetical protein